MGIKQIETICFDVEKELSKPTKLIYYQKIEDILSSIFQRAKDYKNHRKEGIEYTRNKMDVSENGPMEILHYNFDTEKTEFWYYRKKSLFKGLMLAYENHYQITISPDMLLILFLQ